MTKLVQAPRGPAVAVLLVALCSTAGTVRTGDHPAVAITAAGHWPQFRGAYACGVADNQRLPDTWDAASGEHIRWRSKVPGLAHACPIVWGDKLFVTSALSSQDDATIQPGLYGWGDASDDSSVHKFVVYCLDKKTGDILWERVAHEGVPRSKRHIKATYNNCTPATDGTRVVAHFGSEGLYAFDMNGKALWKKDLGDLDVGAYNDAAYEWGPASSPIIWDGKVIVQCDTSDRDFVMALNVETGETIWTTPRDELPGWGTPTVYPHAGRPELIANASNFIMGYDPSTGRELWRLGGSSQITAPTPIFADDLLVVCSGRNPEAPIFAIRPGATGDISLAPGETTNSTVAWSKVKRGPYMPTPIIYRGLLYTLQNQGFLTCYDLRSGEQKYRKRLPHGGAGFSASPVGADGKLYLPSEDGDVFIIKAGETFEVLGTPAMGEVLMATPAISDGTIFIRGEHHLFAVGR